MTVKIKVSVSQHALLSGCDGGNGVYSFFTFFFFGSRRLAKFLWRNLGKNRSQLWEHRSGSLASSRLIISVCGNITKKGCLSLCLMSSLHWNGCERFKPSAPGSATLWRTNPERFGFSQQVKTRMDDITGMKSPQNVSASLSTYLDVVDWVNVLHRVHHNFSYLDRRRCHVTGTFHFKMIPWMSANLFDTSRKKTNTEDMKC